MALELYAHQRRENAVYNAWCSALGVPEQVERFRDIPFLPIGFFKTHPVVSFSGAPVQVFESSGTTGVQTARHAIADLGWYERSLRLGFERIFGDPKGWRFLALLPHYLERGQSSLVWMCRSLMEASGHEGGFFLRDWDALDAHLARAEADEHGPKVMLIGASYALLDWAEQRPRRLERTTVVETGGMKGRGRELLREELHARLQKALGLDGIASEYGMTELLSQAWSRAEGVFETPSWMRCLVRDPRDPLDPGAAVGRGCLNVVDLANAESCSFIATDDLVRIEPDGQIFVEGRRDGSDVRGCNLLSFNA
ncbi:acyl transferase [bacterium]|nr:acyl transferase [bacterium]